MIVAPHAANRIRNLSLSALHLIAAETDCDVPYILALLTEPLRADAPGAQTVPLAPAQSSPAGSDAVAIPATHSPETATKSTAARKDEHAGKMAAGDRALSPSEATAPPETLGHASAKPAGTQAPPVDTPLPPRAPEKAADAPPAGEPSPHVSPAPNRDQPPPQPVRPERSTSVPAKRPAAIVVPPAGKVTTILDRVRVVHQQHPTWTASMIAKHLGANANSVSTLLATVRRQERGEQAPPPPAIKPEFEGRAELLEHYDGVGKRLGKVR